MKRILVCTAQVPFARGGAELLAEGLVNALRQAGHEADLVALPFTRTPHRELLNSALAWRMLDLSHVEDRPVDQVICTKFPSYAVAHPKKVVWLVHQHRQLYDWRGTNWSDWGSQPDDDQLARTLTKLDHQALAEAKRRFSISKIVSQRLQRFNDLASTPLYPPSIYSGRLRQGSYKPYILSISRLDQAKRLDLLLHALAYTEQPVKAIIGGRGPAMAELQALSKQLGLEQRVEFRGWMDDQTLIDLYADARAVFYAPIDEDFGFATIEALEAAKPVLTAQDSGTVLEFIHDGLTGFVAPAEPRAMAARLDALWQSPDLAANLGSNGPAMVANIRWEHVVKQLVLT
ncbi:glycosyltransferase family 4 protein [Herpetosiphon llansteffanensis]|uniref:glycosyltransferase family 4 protein n=1 Tax=Herpetosiphon llansteffanensis TaxID=2094568 RepID=UPI000D7D0448|nr:glycosyltransferase family 4 protein [Herpetosiphon llansteffanensis]